MTHNMTLRYDIATHDLTRYDITSIYILSISSSLDDPFHCVGSSLKFFFLARKPCLLMIHSMIVYFLFEFLFTLSYSGYCSFLCS